MMIVQTINPSTESLIAEYPYLSEQQLNQKLIKGEQAFRTWKRVPLSQRCLPVLNLAHLLRREEKKLANLMTLEMGKPITQSLSEVEKCAMICEFFAEHAAEYLAPCPVILSYQKSTILYQPLGIIYGVMPWNYPLLQIIRFAIPTLIAGNAVVLKHAPNVTGLSLMVEQLFQEAGFLPDLYQALILELPMASALIASPSIAAMSFTGSYRTGVFLAEKAAKVCKKIILEMGGSDPYLVLEDADLDLAAHHIVQSRMTNAGQVCISAKRAILCRPIYNAMKEKILALMQMYKPEDPTRATTTLGPLARQDLVTQLQRQVDHSIASGAQLLLGGSKPDMKGYFYNPTVLEQVHHGMCVFDEETFGPVLPLICVADEQEAIQIANRHDYGLSAAIFTSDTTRGERIANELEAGVVHINSIVRSHPALPFGGIKKSGIGKELGKEGIHAFTNIQSVVVA